MTDNTDLPVPTVENDSLSHVTIDAGTLEFSADDMTATGLLVPYGVEARTNVGIFTVDSGVFSIPEDAMGSVLNVEHKREDTVGGVSRYWEQPEGLFASFKFANTPEGRAAFAEAKDGKRKHLSVEASGVKIRDGKATAGRVFGAALVAQPAFPGATLLASAQDTPAESAPAWDDLPDDVKADLVVRIIAQTTEFYAAQRDASESAEADTDTSSVADAAEDTTPPAVPAEDNPNNEEPLMATEVNAGTVPATLLAGAPAAKEVNLGTVFAAMSNVKNGDPNASADSATLLAALADIKAEASGGLTTAGSGIIPATFAGKLWQGKRYQARYLDLFNHTFGGISLGGRKGFKIAQGTALGAEIANAAQKVELPTGTATTSLYGSTLRKFGFAADYALEWSYLDGGADVLQAFFEGVIDSIAKLMDEAALSTAFTVASKTTTALDRLVAPGTYPTQYPAAMGQLIQGIDLVSDNGDDATFAIVNPTAWTQLLYTPKDLVPEFVEFGVGIGTGEATAGKVKVVKAPASFFTGLGAAKPQVLVGAKNAIEFREQHVEIDALEVAKFGVDKAQVAFLETFVVRPESLSIIGAV